jgi:hypothetical protein
MIIIQPDQNFYNTQTIEASCGQKETQLNARIIHTSFPNFEILPLPPNGAIIPCS